MGVFGGYTRWAVVFLIIFVLFFLLCPNYGYGAMGSKTTTVAHYDTMSYDAYGYGASTGSPYGYGAYGEAESST